MPEIDVRLDTGELDVKLRLHTERAIPILDIEFAKGVTVNGSPDSYREFCRDLLDLIDATCPPPRNEYADIPVHDGLARPCFVAGAGSEVWCLTHDQKPTRCDAAADSGQPS